MFSGPLVIKEVGYELWEVVEPFRFTSETGIVVDVPVFFETDLASIPRILQSMLGKIGTYSQAGVVHDLLYYNHRSGLDTTITRKQADQILREGCSLKAKEYGVADQSDIIYNGCRIGALSLWETLKERMDRLSSGDDEFLDN